METKVEVAKASTFFCRIGNFVSYTTKASGFNRKFVSAKQKIAVAGKQ